ncbi:hypothetical protein GYMLUDRAFT_150751 [Collybiopsis luxurians FD-317 M1]|nr:hypothetical protein GYMLUDRAFT_150751 [Collybiopsis luxurians FD-317 M1]
MSRPTVSSSAGTDRDIMEGLLPVPIQRLKVPRTEAAFSGLVKIGNLQYIGSYNWMKNPDNQPTIVVPGSPPEWQNVATPYNVPADQGVRSNIDQNSFWCPSSNLAPLIVAVNTQQVESGKQPFNWSSVDLVTDRNGLRKLLRWINGTAEKDFRIDTQLAGNSTVLFSRWEKRTQEVMTGFTFGFNFEDKTTKPVTGCEESTGHHRIVDYDFNGLKIVLRFEVDACLPSSTSPILSKNASFDVDDLSRVFSAASISSANVNRPTYSSVNIGGMHTLRVGRAGSAVPQSSLIELSTRSQKRVAENRWREDFPQLFLSQTPYHFLGVHQSGRFIDVQKRQLKTSTDLVEAEKICQPAFQKLRIVLGLIQRLLMDAGEEGRLSIVCRNGMLAIYERKSETSLLSESFLRQFRANK